jgi:hypothetical protein
MTRLPPRLLTYSSTAFFVDTGGVSVEADRAVDERGPLTSDTGRGVKRSMKVLD